MATSGLINIGGGSSTPMTGATALLDGESGAVPTPLAGEEAYLLSGAGTWVESPTTQALSNVSLTMSNPNGAIGTATTTIGSGYNVANLSAVALDVRYDPSGIVNTGNNSFTIQTTGTYEIIWGGIVNATNPTTYLRKNGARVGGIINIDSNNTASSFVYLAPLVAGDRLEIEIIANLGSMSVTLKQLPIAVAPVVNTVAEYGEQVLTPTTIGAATVDITGGSFTLPSAGTWEVEYFGNISLNAGNIVGALLIADISNVEVANSRSVTGAGGSGGGNESAMVSNKVRIVTSAPTTYKIRGIGNAANVSLSAGLAMGGAGNKVTWTKIAGQLPSTGTTVDYVNVNRTSAQAVSNNSAILFNETISGNIPYNSVTGRFTLTAGKTYKLEGNVAIIDSAAIIVTKWYNVTNSSNISPGAYNGAGNYAGVVGSNQAGAIFTPTVTTEVELRNISGTTKTIGGTSVATNDGSSSATITQLGSTSNTVGTLPAVDQSSAGYFTVGNLKYMWGTGNTNGLSTVTLPTAFSTTNYSVITSYVGGNTIVVNPTNTKTTTTFQVNSFFAPDGGPSGSASFDYIAIGQ